MNDIDIKLGADYTGAPAFKKATNDVFSLEKSVKNLAKQFGLVFGAQQVIQFGKESVMAFANSEAQAQQLTTALTNLGLSLSAQPIDEYLQKLELAVGVTRDKLQPALLDLLSVTGSINKSQKLLNASLDIQASGLMDVQQAANILSKAYVGNKKGLKELRLGLTTAELDLLTFDQVLALVEQRFSGQLQAKLGTTASNIERMGIAGRQAKTLIGEGLVNSFSILAGNGSIDAATTKLVQFGQAASNVLQTVSALIAGVLGGDFKGMANNLLSIWSGKKTNASAAGDAAAAAQQKKVEEEAAKRQKYLASLQAKAAKDQAALLKVQRQKAIFDLKKIQIEAALRGQISDEDRKRLLLLKEITENEIDRVTKYNDILSQTQNKAANLISISKDAKNIPNPYAPWADSLDKSQSMGDRLKGYATTIAGIVANPFTGWFTALFGSSNSANNLSSKLTPLQSLTNPFAKWFDSLAASNPVVNFLKDAAGWIAKITDNPFDPWRASVALAHGIVNFLWELTKTIIRNITNPYAAWKSVLDFTMKTLSDIWKFISTNFKTLTNPFSSWGTGIQSVWDKLKNLWKWLWERDWNPFNGKSSVSSTSYAGVSASVGSAAMSNNVSNNQSVNINVSGAIDPYGTANAIADVLNLSATAVGSYANLGVSKTLVSYA